jgi:hypothetical protein
VLKRIHEVLQIALELLGILLVAAGLGVLVAWWFGSAGFLIASGVTVLGAAYLGERRLHPPRRPVPVAEVAPVARTRPSASDVPAQTIERNWWRFGWLSTGRPARERSMIAWTWGRLIWLRDPSEKPP